MNYLTILFNFGPMLWTLVQMIEKQMPASPGKVKLDAAIAFVNAVEPTIADALPAITSVINGIVAANNAAGLFKKAGPAPVASAG